MARRPAIMLYKGDWKRDPQLSMCSPATRGIWLDLICDMDDLEHPTITGTAAMIARTCRASESEVIFALNELKSSGTATILQKNDVFSVTCRRMAKDFKISKIRSNAVQNRYKTSTKKDTKEVQNAEDANANANANANAVATELKVKSLDLDSVYGAYPRKIGRGAAIKAITHAFHRLIAGEGTVKFDPAGAVDYLQSAVEAFADSPAGKAGEYTPHPATWFNQSRYLDDPKEWQRNSNGGNNGANHSSGFNETRAERNVREALALMDAEQAQTDGGDDRSAASIG